MGIGIDALAMRVMGPWGSPLAFAGALALAAMASSFLFGVMLMLEARLGLSHGHAYAALGSPGYKHFVRLRVRAGTQGMSQVDAWVVGIVDPIARPSPVLIDCFRFAPFD
jgi:hypothetical protein